MIASDLIVLFGGQSAEHDVSRVNGAPCAGRHRSHEVSTSRRSASRVRVVGCKPTTPSPRSPRAPKRCPNGSSPDGPGVRPVAGSRRRRARGSHRRGVPAAARAARRRRHGAGPARVGRRPVCRRRRAQLGAGHGQGQGQRSARLPRHPAGPFAVDPRERLRRGDARPSWSKCSACRCSSSRPTSGRRSASARPRRCRPAGRDRPRVQLRRVDRRRRSDRRAARSNARCWATCNPGRRCPARSDPRPSSTTTTRSTSTTPLTCWCPRR